MRIKLVLTGSTASARTYDTTRGPCREYTTSAVIDGKMQLAHATDCREPDGTRQIVS
jgi:surface antigen